VGPIRYCYDLSYPNTVRLVGGQPLAGLMAAQRWPPSGQILFYFDETTKLAAHRAWTWEVWRYFTLGVPGPSRPPSSFTPGYKGEKSKEKRSMVIIGVRRGVSNGVEDGHFRGGPPEKR
jgi:hypothetical protein